jgi:putative transposase
MARQRHRYTADFKAKGALAAIKGQQTVHELATTYAVHPNQVLPWKKQALEAWPDVFSSRRARAAQDDDTLQARLYQPIGQLQVALDWLKKKLDGPLEQRRQWVDPHHQQISVRRQCQLLGVNRAGLYDQAVDEQKDHLPRMCLLDEQ